MLCNASVEAGVPRWLRGKHQGWVTAEYGMLPRATHTRGGREATRGKQGGRTLEIQRLIGRSLRAAVNLKKLGEFTITVDCDVIQADGGTRTAAITGGCVALVDALRYLQREKKIKSDPLKQLVNSMSVGIYKGVPVVDLDYPEDSSADTDMNVVMTEGGGSDRSAGHRRGGRVQPHRAQRHARLGRTGRQHADPLSARSAGNARLINKPNATR